MKRIYSLRIRGANPAAIDNVLGTSVAESKTRWAFELEESEGDGPIDFVTEFLGLLEGKYSRLEAIGVQREDIAAWLLYEYDEQCNLEFSATELQRLGEHGVALCLSCWQK